MINYDKKNIIACVFQKKKLSLQTQKGKIMSNIYQEYERQKTKEVILYILSKTGDTGYFRLMKTMFCADRQNLLRWGCQITDLEYYARQHGPVPLSVHDSILSAYQGADSDFSDILTVNGHFMLVHPTRKPNLDYLSESDIESIDKAIEELKGKNRNKIEKYLHDSVYYKIMASTHKKYSHDDIVMSASASERQIRKVRLEDQIVKALS